MTELRKKLKKYIKQSPKNSKNLTMVNIKGHSTYSSTNHVLLMKGKAYCLNI